MSSFAYYSSNGGGGGSRRSMLSRTTDDFQHSSVSLAAAAIHKAIRDGEYSQLPDLVTQHHPARLVWEEAKTNNYSSSSSSTGWTAVHYAASHFLPVEWWGWILERAVTADDVTADGGGAAESKFVTCRNALGQSVMDVFLQTYVAPLPWQSIQVRKRSRLLRQAMKEVCACQALQHAVQTWITGIHSSRTSTTTTAVAGADAGVGTGAAAFDFVHHAPGAVVVTGTATERDPPAAVQRVVSFWIALDLLRRAATATTMVHESSSLGHCCSDLHHMLSFLASAGGCPKPVADLVLVLLQKNAAQELSSFDGSFDGSLPLHLWAASRTNCHDQDGMLEPLLHAYPEAVALPDKDGRWPLHLALESGKSWARIRPLVDKFPDALHLVDHHSTGLTAAALAAVAAVDHQDSVEIRARKRTTGDKGGLVSVWNLISSARKQEARQQAVDELSCERLTTIYQVLRAFPQVLCSHAVETVERRGPDQTN